MAIGYYHEGLRWGLGKVAPVRLETVGPNVSGGNGYTWLHIYKQDDDIIISYVEKNITRKTIFEPGIIINGRIINDITLTPVGNGDMKAEVDYDFSDEMFDRASRERELQSLVSNS